MTKKIIISGFLCLSLSIAIAQENEDILVHTIPRVSAFELLEQGKINNSATVIGLQWLQLNYRRLQQRWQ